MQLENVAVYWPRLAANILSSKVVANSMRLRAIGLSAAAGHRAKRDQRRIAAWLVEWLDQLWCGIFEVERGSISR